MATAKQQNSELDAQRSIVVREAKELLEQELNYRKQMRAYRDMRHEQCDPLGLSLNLEDDPNWLWWQDMINDIESAVEGLRDDYRRITRLMES